jgi:hypothetical protein
VRRTEDPLANENLRHELMPLWMELRALLRELLSCEVEEEFPATEDLISQLDEGDPQSFASAARQIRLKKCRYQRSPTLWAQPGVDHGQCVLDVHRHSLVVDRAGSARS